MKLIPENCLQVSHHSRVSLIVNLATKQNKGTLNPRSVGETEEVTQVLR